MQMYPQSNRNYITSYLLRILQFISNELLRDEKGAITLLLSRSECIPITSIGGCSKGSPPSTERGVGPSRVRMTQVSPSNVTLYFDKRIILSLR